MLIRVARHVKSVVTNVLVDVTFIPPCISDLVVT